MLRICSTSPDDIKALLQGTLHVRADTYPAFQAVLPHISPAISGHPFFPTVGALELPEASFRTLIRGETWLPGACQGTVLDEMTLLNTQMTQVGATGLSQRPTGESRRDGDDSFKFSFSIQVDRSRHVIQNRSCS